MKLYLALLLCFGNLTFTASAQEFQLPENVTLNAKEDYAKYEKDIINAAKWLETTPISEKDNQRILVNVFVMQWLTGSPTVTFTARPVMLSLVDKNPNLMITFMASYARWTLENNYSKEEQPGYLAGIRSIIKLYGLGGAVKKDKDLQKVIEAEKAGTLETWLKENFENKK